MKGIFYIFVILIFLKIIIMNNQEIWKDVSGHEGFYQVSNLGNFKSLDRIGFNPRYGEQVLKGKLIIPKKEHTGYYQVRLNKLAERRSEERRVG